MKMDMAAKCFLHLFLLWLMDPHPRASCPGHMTPPYHQNPIIIQVKDTSKGSIKCTLMLLVQKAVHQKHFLQAKIEHKITIWDPSRENFRILLFCIHVIQCSNL